jgi:HKD family nuclease
MHTINNRTEQNHLEQIKRCFLKADEILIVSPFLSDDMNFLAFEQLTHLKKITLVTRLKPYTLDQYDKVNFLFELFTYGQENNIQIEVLIDNFLHGKVYIGIKDGMFSEAIITSANFNRHGLVINNEWGVCLTDKPEIALMVQEIYRNIFLEGVNIDQVKKFKAIINQHPKEKRKKEVGLNLVKQLSVLANPLHIKPKTIYWLKPIGVTGNPIRWGESFGQKQYPLHFHENPAGVKIGHIIIAYAIEHNNVLSIYEVITDTKNTGVPSDRWPFFVMGRNLTIHYGDEWFKHNFTNRDQRTEAITLGQFSVTPSGKDSYGRLNHGGDKLRLTPEFANFLIDRLMIINKQISEHSENSQS